MTVKNIVAGFKVTGIYPFNPIAMSIQEDSDSAASLREATGVAYIPLFTPPKKRGQSSPELSSSLLSTSSLHLSPLSFSNSPSPSHDLNDYVVYALPKRSTLTKFLNYPQPPSKRDPPKKIASAKGLTSSQNLKVLEEKEKRKQQEAEAKEKHKQEQESKAREREKRKQELAQEKKKRRSEREIQAGKEELKKATAKKKAKGKLENETKGGGKKKTAETGAQGLTVAIHKKRGRVVHTEDGEWI